MSADTTCGDNSVLLFSARGSGDVYGGDLAHNKIGAWTQGAAIQLIAHGWNVRDLQAIYPAPPVPLKKIGEALLTNGFNAKGLAVAGVIVNQYRNVATQYWPSVKAELEAAYSRCTTRKIFVAGYSQGAILLRYIIPRLDPKILAQIVSVDLIADPTEQRAVDSGLQHPRNLDGRLTNEGIDTFSGRVLNDAVHKSFRQNAYPPSVAGHTFQYCVDIDLVCDFNLANIDPRYAIPLEGKIHASYGFELTGLAAGHRLGDAPARPPTSSGILHTLNLNFSTGSVTLDGVAFRAVSNLGGRFDRDPQNFLGASDAGCTDAPGSTSSSPHQTAMSWSAKNPAGDPSIWMHLSGGSSACDVGSSVIDSFQVHSWFADPTIRVQTDLGSFNLGTAPSTLPAQLTSTMSSDGSSYRRCIGNAEVVTIEIDRPGPGHEYIMDVWVDALGTARC